MASVARAPYRAEIAWGSYATGLFTIGSSLIGGPDTLGSAPYSDQFTGPYDNVSGDVERVTITRGRDDTLTQMNAGEATIILRDPRGFYSPQNASSGIAATIEDRLHPARVSAKIPQPIPFYEPLFYGYTKRIVWEPSGRRGVTQIDLVDFFYWLERAFPVIASTGTTTTGAAIGKVLDAVGWPTSAALRSLDVGDTIPDFSADGSVNGLDLIGALLEAERGVFYIDAAGLPTYESRHRRTLRVVAGFTITNEMSRASPSVDFGLIRNRVRVKRSQTNYVATAQDASSVAKVGWNDLGEIETSYLNSDSQADGLAQWLLQQVRQPRPPVRSLTIDNRTLELLTAIVHARLVDRWKIQEAKGGTNADFFIERLEHAIDFAARGKHSLALTLSEASGVTPFTIGVSRFVATLKNFIPNPSMETNLTGWTAYSGSLAQVGAHAAAGDYSTRCKVTLGAGDYGGYNNQVGLSGATAGQNWAGSLSIYAEGAAVGKTLRLMLREVGGAFAFEETYTEVVLVAGVQRVTVTRTINRNDRLWLELWAYRPSGAAFGEYFDFDAGMLELAADASPYFDGDSPGSAWTGTPHASASTKVLGGDVLVY